MFFGPSAFKVVDEERMFSQLFPTNRAFSMALKLVGGASKLPHRNADFKKNFRTHSGYYP